MCRYRYLGRRTSSILVTIIGSARVVKTLMGGGRATTFHADLKRDGHYSCKGMVYAKMFYGGDGVVFRGDGIPLKSSSLLIIGASLVVI